MKLKNTDFIEYVFKTSDNREISVLIPISRIIELTENEAYEVVTSQDCNDSSCAVNNYCKCDPINEDAELKYIKLHTDLK